MAIWSGGLGSARRQMNPELRRAVETHAVAIESAHYEERGWSLDDVGTKECFDLRCRREEQELHVEVKGTTTRGEALVLTRNEVKHAKNQFPRVALFCVSGIEVVQERPPVLNGGKTRIFDPWDIRGFPLEPLTYEIGIPLELD